MARRLARVLNNPKVWVRVHGTLVVIWALMSIPAVMLWRDSVAFIVLVSVYANIAGSMASLQAARADCNSVDAVDFRKLDAKVVELLRRVPEPSAHNDLYWSMVSLMRKRERG